MPPGWSASNPTAGWSTGGYAASAVPLAYTGYVKNNAGVWGQYACSSGFNCTQYAAYRLANNNAPNFVSGACASGAGSDAQSWDERARRCGVRVDDTPKAGSVMQWDGHVDGMSSAGHVAYVDAVYGDTVLVSMASCSNGEKRTVYSLSSLRAGGYLTTRSGQANPGIEFIHPKDLNNPGAVIPESKARTYVTAMYEDLLRRDPDAAGLDFWTQKLVTGTLSYGGLVDGFTGSTEYRSALIEDSYRQYLGRGADSGGLSTWLGQMQGGSRIEDVQIQLIASGEFYSKAGGTDAGFVTRLYQTVLGRTPASSEVSHWVAKINGGQSRGDVASGFVFSTEHLNSVVDGYYRLLLKRSADASGLATWVGRIQGGWHDEQVINALATSQEFMNKL